MRTMQKQHETAQGWYESLGENIAGLAHPVVSYEEALGDIDALVESLVASDIELDVPEWVDTANATAMTEWRSKIFATWAGYSRRAAEAAREIEDGLNDAVDAVNEGMFVAAKAAYAEAREIELEWGDTPSCSEFERAFERAFGVEWIEFPFAPDFEDMKEGLAPGVYESSNLNPPSGKDCIGIRVRDDGSLGWADTDGDCGEYRFSVADLCGDDEDEDEDEVIGPRGGVTRQRL